MANYHYDEAGNMAAYFLITFLALVLTPFTLSISPLSKQSPPPGCRCQPCLDQRKRIDRQEHGSLLNPKFNKKAILITAGWCIFAYLCFKVAGAKIENKVYDPFEILGLGSGVTQKEIKSHFKKLSRMYHPDKVQLSANVTMEWVESRFVEITKAYKSLTDETIRKNWELYGHPDGRQEVSMGIALPHWIIEGKNNIWVLGAYALIFGGALPLMVGRWWFGTRQKTKDGVNARSAAVFFKSLKEGSGMDEVVGILGKAFEWEWSKAQKTATTEVDGIEAKIEQNLGDKWRQIRRQAGSVGHDYFDSKRKALVLLYSHLLRIPVSNSLRKEQTQLLLHTPCLLNSFLLTSISRNWLTPTLSVMRLHAYLTQALTPGNERLRFAQLPYIQGDELPNLGGNAVNLEEFVRSLDAKSDSRVTDIKKAVQTWGRLELVDVSFKVIGERVVTPASIVFFVIKLRLSPPRDYLTPQTPSEEGDADEVKRKIKLNEDKDAEFLTSRKEAEDLLDNSVCGWAHAPYWPANRKPAWWLVLADDKTKRIVVPPMKITDVPFSRPNEERDFRSYKMQFQAPQTAGLFTWRVYLVSDTFIGEEVTRDVTLKIEDVSVLGADEQGLAEDVISDPEEDTLAGQMALMKGAAVKKVANDDSDEESSTDDDKESDSDSDSD